ncbi:S-Ena type endospore appendage [Longirhabdus pacifica]|uniref:S-Ena type endospore appendage n=1 Tax=Longirhabdus pacifica TaxID=2305227 RepID=UPI001009195E|nr:S-Ena type endospore appendage [Longirhabdus pacifica]
MSLRKKKKAVCLQDRLELSFEVPTVERVLYEAIPSQGKNGIITLKNPISSNLELRFTHPDGTTTMIDLKPTSTTFSYEDVQRIAIRKSIGTESVAVDYAICLEIEKGKLCNFDSVNLEKEEIPPLNTSILFQSIFGGSKTGGFVVKAFDEVVELTFITSSETFTRNVLIGEAKAFSIEDVKQINIKNTNQSNIANVEYVFCTVISNQK